MKTPTVTSSTDSQMHNNIMAAGSRDRPPMIATGRYPQWRSRFLRYIDTRPNGDALRKCILSGPYKPTTPEWSRFVTIVKKQHKLDEVSYHKLFDILKQYQKEVNELRDERLARNVNPSTLVATAQANQDPYYLTSKSHKSYAPSSKPSILTRTHTTTRYKGKEIAKPITPPSKTTSEEDNDHEQDQRDKDMQKNLALIAKYFKNIYKPTNNNLRTSTNSRNKNVDMTSWYKNDNQSGQFGTELQKECRQKPKRVKDSAYQNEKMLLCKQDEKETDDSNIFPDSPDMCNDDIYNEQNDVESDDERVALANLKLDVDEKKTEFEKYKAFNDRTVDNDKLERKLNETLGQLAQKDIEIKEDQFHAPTAQDMEILIQTCLMPLAIKTHNDSFIFVHELKQEMHDDLKYVESLEKEIDELKSDKGGFSNMYDMILQECVSNDAMCSYFLSLSDLDALAELQCLYLHKVKECDCLAQKLSTQTEFVSKEVHTELLQRFAKVEKHFITLKISLQKCKGKSVDTKSNEPSVVQQPNAQRIPKPSVLGKPAPFLDSLERRYFSKTKSVPKTNVSEGLPKPVTAQTLPQTARQAVSNTNVLKPGMINHKTNVSRPHHRSNQLKDKVVPNNSQVKPKKTQVEEHPRISSIYNKTKSVTVCNDSLNSRTSNVNAVCATCGKCLVDCNHFAYVTKMLNDVNDRTKKPNVVPISTRKPKGHANKSVATTHKKKVASKSIIRNHRVTLGCCMRKQIVQLILFIVDSGCAKHMMGNLKLLCNFVQKFLGTVRFGNDQFAPILGYGDLVQGNITINRVYYVKGLNHNLFSVSQFYDADLEVAFQKATCFVRDLQGNDLLIVSKAKSSFKSKAVPSSKGRLNLLHMNLCGPMRVASINGKKYILVIVDNYSRYTWTLFLRFKDETPKVLKEFFTMIQRNLQALVITVRTDRGTEFLNKALNAFFKEEGIEHQTSTARTPEQNDAEVIATACYTQNRSVIIPTNDKMGYHIINDRKPSIKHLHISGCICYITRDGENLDKMIEKGDLCILVGYSTQSRGYRVYNKRTRLIVKSIHIRFDEIKEVSETSVANDTSGLVPQRKKASDYDNSDPVPQLHNVSPSANAHVPSQQEMDPLFGPLYNDVFNAGYNPQETQPTKNTQPTSAPSTPTYVHTEENNDHQAEEEHLPDDEFTNPFCASAQEVAESSSHNIGNSNFPTFNQPQVFEYRWTKDHKLEQVCRNPSRPVQTSTQVFSILLDGRENGISQWSTEGGGFQIHQSPRGIFINQAKYAFEILHKHGMEKGQRIGIPMATKPKLDADFSENPVDQTDYHSKIKSLMYLTSSRPDIVQAGSSFGLTAFLDVDHAGCIDSRKSAYGGIQFLGDKIVSWMSKKHDCIAMSLAEAEYVTLSTSCTHVKNGIIELYFVRTEYQLADMFTKALPKDRFKYLVRRIGMRCLTPAELEVLAKESA
nr:hypothetical protein [Tanacetum cinerariifolium]